MRVDLEVVQGHLPWQEIRRRALLAEELGFSGFWLSDHLLPPLGDPAGSMLEAWTMLAALARETQRIRLGVLVTPVTFRHPAILIAQAVTLDHLSEGRLDIGLGAGWLRSEHEQFGIPFPSFPQRVAMLDEFLTVLKGLLQGECVNFEGRFFHLHDAVYLPLSLQRPRPPLWIGASGERLMLPIVARHADVWHGRADSLQAYEQKSAILDHYLKEAGRSTGEINKCLALNFDEDPLVLFKIALRLRPQGFDRIVGSWPVKSDECLQAFATTYLPMLEKL